MIQKGLSNLPILVQIPDLASLPAQPAVAEKQPPPKEERYTAPKTSAPEEKQNIPSTRLIGHRLSAKILALAGILLISAAVGPMLWNHKAKEKPTEESLVEWQTPPAPDAEAAPTWATPGKTASSTDPPATSTSADPLATTIKAPILGVPDLAEAPPTPPPAKKTEDILPKKSAASTDSFVDSSHSQTTPANDRTVTPWSPRDLSRPGSEPNASATNVEYTARRFEQHPMENGPASAFPRATTPTMPETPQNSTPFSPTMNTMTPSASYGNPAPATAGSTPATGTQGSIRYYSPGIRYNNPK